jgi:hypothetical protein
MSNFYETAAHVLPATGSEQRQHVLDEFCWCLPVIDTDAWEIQHQPEGSPLVRPYYSSDG